MPAKNRSLIYASTGLVLATAIAVGAFMFFSITPPVSAATPAEILARNGYLEIRPASKLNGPGTLNTVEVKTDSYVILHRTCRMDMAEIEALWATSQTTRENVAQQLEGRFNADSSLITRARLKVGVSKIKNIVVSFSNTKIVQLDDETVFILQRKYLKDTCEQVIRQLIKNNKCVTQPYEVLRSDLVYAVDYDQGISEEEKAKLTDMIIAEISTNAKRADSDTITGENLFFGIKLSVGCIVLNASDAREKRL